MRRVICFFLLAAMILPVFSGCAAKEDKAVTCQDVVAAYEDAGYAVYHRNYPDKDYGYTCRIEVAGDDGNYIFFHFFETEQEATAYAEDHKWNLAVWFVTLAMFQPTWVKTETYHNIAIEYEDGDLYRPFKALVK